MKFRVGLSILNCIESARIAEPHSIEQGPESIMKIVVSRAFKAGAVAMTPTFDGVFVLRRLTG